MAATTTAAAVAMNLKHRPSVVSESRSRRFASVAEKENRFLDWRCSKKFGVSIGVSRRELKSASYCRKFDVSAELETRKFDAKFDEALELKGKADDIVTHLDNRCIYLVGMMGSGKTTVGKILSEVLGYSFFDSDKLVEQAVGMSSVAQIFKERSEAFFRDNESEVLKDLSTMHKLVVATGGGAVIRPINWRYMKRGISIWLDVPLEALAKRIVAVGTSSRPLLNQEHGDPYANAYARLCSLAEKRVEAYANADCKVCLDEIADKHGYPDVCSLTPTDIADEALVKIESFLTEAASIERRAYLQG